jgi:hypothetical protein
MTSLSRDREPLVAHLLCKCWTPVPVAARARTLPHLAQRPLTLKRFADDIYGEMFWEKDAPSFTPKWIERLTEQLPFGLLRPYEFEGMV